MNTSIVFTPEPSCVFSMVIQRPGYTIRKRIYQLRFLYDNKLSFSKLENNDIPSFENNSYISNIYLPYSMDAIIYMCSYHLYKFVEKYRTDLVSYVLQYLQHFQEKFKYVPESIFEPIVKVIHYDIDQYI